MRQGAVDRGDDPDELPRAYAQLINAALAGRPDDLTVGIHLCRGNYRSTWFAQGGYEPVAEVLFNDLEVDAFFLEYDDERSGDFAPLRHVPAGRTVVLGLITSKRPDLEPYDEVAARVAEAAAHVDQDQLCLSPQCGFASTIEGNALTEDQQWAKLRHVVELGWSYLAVGRVGGDATGSPVDPVVLGADRASSRLFGTQKRGPNRGAPIGAPRSRASGPISRSASSPVVPVDVVDPVVVPVEGGGQVQG